MTVEQDDRPHALPVRVVLWSIVGFWAFYCLVVTVRAAVLGLDDQWAMFGPRLGVACVSAIITYGFYLALRTQPIGSIRRSIMLVAVLSIPASFAYSAINQYAFREFNDRIEAKEKAKKIVVVDRSERSDGSVHIVKPGAEIHIGKSATDDPVIPVPPTPPVPPVPPASPAPPSSGVYVQVGDMGGDEQDATPFQKISDHAVNSYFFFVAWAAFYLALCYANETRYFERRAARHSAAAQAAELKALRYQVNPHFLFNTLNSLSSLIMTAKPAEAEQMIINLSNFFRTSLSAHPTEDVTLEEEIHLQRLYLEIEQVRFPTRLKTDIVIADGLGSACVPALILQPLVENAVKYGVSPAKDPVTIRICAREDSGGLILSVENDGRQLDKEQPANGMGVGLRNVRDRLAARFGTEAGCRWGPLPQGGFGVTLTMPIIRDGC
ncbi:MAG: histidine kinase [Sphingobium sp.]